MPVSKNMGDSLTIWAVIN